VLLLTYSENPWCLYESRVFFFELKAGLIYRFLVEKNGKVWKTPKNGIIKKEGGSS
jgi:hypothetical protein